MVEVFPTLMAIDEAELILVGTIAGVIFLVIVGTFFIISRFYRQVDQGKALIVNKKAGPQVVFTGTVVLPIIHRAEIMDISVKSLDIDRRGKDGLICKDNIRADIKVTFFVRVNKTVDDVLRVAQSIGCIRASQQQTLEELFAAKFSEALKTVGKKMEFEQLYTQRDVFKDQIISVIGKDLNGYVLDDAAIDYLEGLGIERVHAHEQALLARAIRSPHHRARFSFGDLDAYVRAAPGVVRILTAADIPGRNLHGVIPPFADQPVFAIDEARFKGEAVAAVVGEAVTILALDAFLRSLRRDDGSRFQHVLDEAISALTQPRNCTV